MRHLRFCAQCNRQRKDDHWDSWLCPYKGKTVYSDTDAEACEGFLFPIGHDRIWDDKEAMVFDI